MIFFFVQPERIANNLLLALLYAAPHLECRFSDNHRVESSTSISKVQEYLIEITSIGISERRSLILCFFPLVIERLPFPCPTCIDLSVSSNLSLFHQ